MSSPSHIVAGKSIVAGKDPTFLSTNNGTPKNHEKEVDINRQSMRHSVAVYEGAEQGVLNKGKSKGWGQNQMEFVDILWMLACSN